MEHFLPLVTAFGLGALISGVVVTWVENKLGQNSENKRRIRERREEQYKKFLDNLVGFYKGWEDEKKQKQFILDVNTSATVSASDKVYRLASYYIGSYDKSKKVVEEAERQRIYAKLVIAMRNELNQLSGECPTHLKEEEIRVMQLD